MGQIQPHRPLWQLLTIVSKPEELATLSCEECFSLFEMLADEAYQDQENPHVRRLIQEHFTFCPDCHLYYDERLRELEANLKERKVEGK